MAMNKEHLQNVFALKSLPVAKVSEISEATAAASVMPEQRVNFHIGNPVQDERLARLFQRLIFGLPIRVEEQLSDPLEELALDEGGMSRLRFLAHVVEQSVAYLPRGGFSGRDPGPLAPRIQDWLGSGQEEPLEYDLGLGKGRRELTMISGGRWEAIRMLFAALANHLERTPAHVYLHRIKLPSPILEIPHLYIKSLPQDETQALESLNFYLQNQPESPQFLLMGSVMSEEARRNLRTLCLEAPLFILEANNAHNHRSLGREAGLSERVLRIFTPETIDPRLWPVSLAFVVGNAEFIQVIETTHFELKGTPAAPEVELCAYLMQMLEEEGIQSYPGLPEGILQKGNERTAAHGPIRVVDGSAKVQRMTQVIEDMVGRVERIIDRGTLPLRRVSDQVEHWVARLPAMRWVMEDPCAGLSVLDVVESFFERSKDSNWHQDLQQALLASFLVHHPEYQGQACTVVSGSARTAFGILGRHCGIREVVTPDLSWTYEHGFANVTAVPLKEDLDLNVPDMIDVISRKLEADPHWREYGAVVINNPHNASGAVFYQEDVTRLVLWLLDQGVRVIDDLSYEDVLPGDHLQNYDTIRRIVSRSIRTGALRREQANLVITVHSFSKTDCLAGARMAVTEILDPVLRKKFRAVTDTIQHNLTALLMVYLFYRRQANEVQQSWTLRNHILDERMKALHAAVNELPDERNPYEIRVDTPAGSMYPRLVVERLPAGVSLDWIASGLAPRGIGLLPFSTFARTAPGFDLAHKSFRLTLGGGDGASLFQRKMRRVMIDLNRLIEDQETLYTFQSLPAIRSIPQEGASVQFTQRRWVEIQSELERNAVRNAKIALSDFSARLDSQTELKHFTMEYLPDRLEVIRQRLFDRARIADAVIDQSLIQGGLPLMAQLERETQPVSLEEKQSAFRTRLYDRTVHPTQMYALEVDVELDRLIGSLLLHNRVDKKTMETLAHHLAVEYVGNNVAINSDQEAEELVVDLHALIDAENWAHLWHDLEFPTLLSFWGDWDGSTRPSGQGHRLAAGALLANVSELSQLLHSLQENGSGIRIDPWLEDQVLQLEASQRKFWDLLNEITELTSHLEERYLRVLPFDVEPGFWRRVGMKLKLARDPISRLWQHNDRLERRMLKLRQKRSESLEYYFHLNQRMQESLRDNLDAIQPLLRDPKVAMRVGFYRNTIKRFVLTPRIHQRMILSRDQFAIDTTVHNLVEINRLAGQYGVPGLVLALQVSMSSDPEALIGLDRKLRQERREQLRHSDEISLPNIWMVPLFEDLETIRSLDSYLDQVWEYAVQSRRLGQESSGRFQEILCEIFFAGSDLSQQIGQPAGDALYRQAKYQLVQWLVDHDLTGSVRTKLGSGESAQRQGGYYDPRGSMPPVLSSQTARRRLGEHLGDAECRAWELARSPLRGVQAGTEFRTFQSNLSEELRRLPTAERLSLLYHVWCSHRKYETELERAASALENTRLQFEEHTLKELEMLTVGNRDPVYEEFLSLAQENFRQILYGRDEDVVGIHVISHFVSRVIPSLRDRPVVRPNREHILGQVHGQEIVGRLARTLPLSQHGSMLRAIGHNHAQTMIIGINQFTSGIFRAMNEFNRSLGSGTERKRALADYVLTELNVYDMLHSLRIYHDPHLTYARKLELTFPAGNSAFVALREDNDLIPQFVPSLQRELLRRSGMDVEDAFFGGRVKLELLPSLRPDVAVLMQPDLFNVDPEILKAQVGGEVDSAWLESVGEFLYMREQVQAWRDEIWKVIEEPIRTQVESFVGLALAIHSLRAGGARTAAPLVAEPAEVERLGAQVVELLRGSADDPLRQFLIAAVQYLTELSGTQADVPVDVLRALQDVERIVKIEEQVLRPEEQTLVRFYALKIARLCGENG